MPLLRKQDPLQNNKCTFYRESYLGEKMEFSKETEEKIRQLQLFEQNMQNVLMQKQNFQSQIIEIENALKELEKSEGKVYKITGTIMIDSNKNKLEKELKERTEILDLRFKSIKKQEDELRKRAETIQKEVMEEIEKKEKK